MGGGLFVSSLEGGNKEGTGTHQLVGFLEGALGGGNGGLPRLAGQLGDLIELLLEVGLHDLELPLVRGEELGAGVGVEGVGHLERFPERAGGSKGIGAGRECRDAGRRGWSAIENGGCI